MAQDDNTTVVGRPPPSTDDDKTAPSHGDGGDLPVGSQVGRFLVVGVLGRGGMGVVYAAYDPVLDRKIAVKLLQYMDDDESSQGRARMQREAQALGRLSHPNVITVHDVAEHDGAMYIAMEIVEGGTLREWRGKRSWREVIAVYLTAARGLAAAHAAKLVHRDFKPDNVLVGSDGRIRVTDFGLARLIGDHAKPIAPTVSMQSPLSGKLTVDGAVMGTPTYMAPEQIDGGVVDARTDQFSWCVALWEALYFEQPFPGTNLALRSAAMKAEPPRPPVRTEVPREVGRALVRGLSAEPGQRWPDLDSLIRELEPVTRASRTPLFAGLGALALASLGLVFALGRTSSSSSNVAAGPGCDAAGGAADTLWTAPQKGELVQAFAATGASFATDSSAALDRGVVAWRERWRASAIESCRMTREIGTQSEALLDLRTACLTRRRAELDNLLAGLAQSPDKGAVERAPSLSLPDLDTCSDPSQLAGVPPRPSDPRIADLEHRLDASERDLVRGMSLARANIALAPALGAAVEAAGLGWKPLLARAWEDAAKVERELGDGKDARSQLLSAAAASSSIGDLDELTAIYLELLDVESRLTSDFQLGDGWAQLAEGTIARLGHRPDKLMALARGRAIAAKRLDHLRTAEKQFAIALELARETHDDIAEVQVLSDLAVVEADRDENAQARAHLEAALPLATARFGAEHPKTAGILHDLGVVEYHDGHYAEAVKIYQRALAIRERAYGPDSIEYATTLESLGVAELQSGSEHLDVATEHVEAAVKLFEARLGPDHPDVANAYNDAGGAYHRAGLYKRAQDTAKHTLALREKALGPEHPDVGQSLVNYAIESKALGEWEVVEPSYVRALAIFVKAYGEANTTTAISHLNFAEALRVEGKLDRAAEQYEIAHVNLVKLLGEGHPILAHIWNGEGQLQLARGNLDLARPLLERAVKIRETDGDATELAESRFALARATPIDGDHGRAITLATAARNAYRNAGAPYAKQLAEVEAWLAKVKP